MTDCEKEEAYFGQNRVCSMTPTEFEEYCLKVLQGYAENEGLLNFTIKHNVKFKASDGTYQIDILATYTALGAEMKIIGECKQYKNHINREKVVLLADKVRTLGAQKGILLSTAGFQRGAIQYANEHGIALVQVFDTRENWYSYSAGPDAPEEDEDNPFTYGERHLPTFQAFLVSDESGTLKTVYPTIAMVTEIYQKINELSLKQYSIDILKELG